MRDHNYYVYIMTNAHNRVLYTGITNDVRNRSGQHNEGGNKRSFTTRYNVKKLVYYERHQDVNVAIAREKQLKAGSRKKKIELIESMNPEWKDLAEGL